MEIRRSLSFVRQCIVRPRSVGAVLPSSKYLAEKMVRHINFDEARCIVEYGPGTGVFTDRMLKGRREDTLILLLESNKKFYMLLKNKYRNVPNLFVIHASAEHIGTYLSQYDRPAADYIISGLPFSSLPAKLSAAILTQTRKYLKPGGKFITFQYTLLKKGLIGHYFPDIRIERTVRNIPPAYVLSCTNKEMCA